MAILTIAGNEWQKRVSAFFRNKVYRKKTHYWYSQNNSNETELHTLMVTLNLWLGSEERRVNHNLTKMDF